jgi:hypothetical protein
MAPEVGPIGKLVRLHKRRELKLKSFKSFALGKSLNLLLDGRQRPSVGSYQKLFF